MDTTTDTNHPDAELIKALGGPSQLAEILGFDKAKGGVQRVQNWITRGIPAAVKVQRPDLFLTRQPIHSITSDTSMSTPAIGEGSVRMG